MSNVIWGAICKCGSIIATLAREPTEKEKQIFANLKFEKVPNRFEQSCKCRAALEIMDICPTEEKRDEAKEKLGRCSCLTLFKIK